MKTLYALLPEKRYAASTPALISHYVRLPQRTKVVLIRSSSSIIQSGQPIQLTFDDFEQMIDDARHGADPLFCFETLREAQQLANMLDSVIVNEKTGQAMSCPVFCVTVDDRNCAEPHLETLQTDAYSVRSNQDAEIKNAKFYQVLPEDINSFDVVYFDTKNVLPCKPQKSACLLL